jgi:hypothetical protein
MRRSPAPNSACAQWPRAPHANSARKNIHIAHLIIDAGVDTEWVRDHIRRREGEAVLANLDPGRLMRPESVAEAYWQIYREPRDAWSSEREIRPFGET